MATLKTIRKRISSVKNTQQITKAMKMVSAAKLRRAQEAAVQARPYAEKMTELLKNVSARVSSEAHPLLTSREEKKVQLVLFTSDRGLCGGYNTNMIRAAEAFIRQHAEDRQIQLTLVGRKGADHFRRRGAEIADRYIDVLYKAPDEFASESPKNSSADLSAAKWTQSISSTAVSVRHCRKCRRWRNSCL